MALAYVLFFRMFNFQNSKYFYIPLLKNLSSSIDFETSLPQIKQNGINFKTPFGSLGQP
jgi:hypothetical protein